MGATKKIFEEEREAELYAEQPSQNDLYELRDAVLNEEANPLSVYIALKEMEKDLAAILKQVQPLALEEAKTYGETTFDAFGAKITVKAGGGRWSYNHIPQWESAKETLKEIEEKAKSAYNNKGFGMIVNDEGEVIEPAEYTSGSETLSISLK